MINVSDKENILLSPELLSTKLTGNPYSFPKEILKILYYLITSEESESIDLKNLTDYNIKLGFEFAKYNIFFIVLQALKDFSNIMPGNIQTEIDNYGLYINYTINTKCSIPLLNIEFPNDEIPIPCINLFYAENNHQELIDKYTKKIEELTLEEKQYLINEKSLLKLLLSGHLIANLRFKFYRQETYYRRKRTLMLEREWLENYGELEYNIYQEFLNVFSNYFPLYDTKTLSTVPINKTKVYRLEI